MSKKGLGALILGAAVAAFGGYQLFKNRGADDYAELELDEDIDAEAFVDDTEESVE